MARLDEVVAARRQPGTDGRPGDRRQPGKYTEDSPPPGRIKRSRRLLSKVEVRLDGIHRGCRTGRGRIRSGGDGRPFACVIGRKRSAKADRLEKQLRLMLVPKDPNDDKDVIVEINGAVGGDQATIWAGDPSVCISTMSGPRAGGSR